MDDGRFPYYVAVFVFVAWTVLTALDVTVKNFNPPTEINYAFGLAVAWSLGGQMIKQVLPPRDPPKTGTHTCPICEDGPLTAADLAAHMRSEHPISKGRHDQS